MSDVLECDSNDSKSTSPLTGEAKSMITLNSAKNDVSDMIYTDGFTCYLPSRSVGLSGEESPIVPGSSTVGIGLKAFFQISLSDTVDEVDS